MDTAEFISREYYKDETVDGAKQIRELMAVPGVYSYGNLDQGFVILYILLSDEGMKILESKKRVSDFTPALSSELLQHPGNHIYAFRCVGTLPPMSIRIKFLKQLTAKHQAHSICWHDDNPERVILHRFNDAHEYVTKAS